MYTGLYIDKVPCHRGGCRAGWEANGGKKKVERIGMTKEKLEKIMEVATRKILRKWSRKEGGS